MGQANDDGDDPQWKGKKMSDSGRERSESESESEIAAAAPKPPEPSRGSTPWCRWHSRARTWEVVWKKRGAREYLGHFATESAGLAALDQWLRAFWDPGGLEEALRQRQQGGKAAQKHRAAAEKLARGEGATRDRAEGAGETGGGEAAAAASDESLLEELERIVAQEEEDSDEGFEP